jgi:hypothetical protein
LGDNDAVLATAGTQAEPIVLRTKAELVTPPPMPVAEVAVPAVRAETSRPFFGPLRVVGVAGIGAGIVCAVVGGVFANSAGGAASQIRGASRDSTGVVTGLTQKDAYQLNERAKGDSTIATGLFAAAGVLGVGGTMLFVFATP